MNELQQDFFFSFLSIEKKNKHDCLSRYMILTKMVSFYCKPYDMHNVSQLYDTSVASQTDCTSAIRYCHIQTVMSAFGVKHIARCQLYNNNQKQILFYFTKYLQKNILYETFHEKTRSDTNWSVQLHKTRSLKFWI